MNSIPPRSKDDSPNTWHSQSTASTFDKLQSSDTGLTSEEASKRLLHYGPNRLPSLARRGTFMRFLSQFNNILIYVLLGSAFVTSLLNHWIDTGVILAVVVANAIIGFVQEGKAEKAMDSIRQMLAPRAAVIRNNERSTIAGKDLVPGDVVLLEAGDKVPADLRLFASNGISIQEAILTGESLPVDKRTEPCPQTAALADRSCMAYSGTLVASGQGKGVVIASGAETEIGRISHLLAEVETLTTPLVKQMDVFAKWLTGIILLVAGFLLVYGYFVAHHDFTELFMSVVGLSVAAIPEGLPAVVTITLAVGVQAMARRHAIVRRLPAIETLGAVSVICSDKTGTLTRNEMMVASVVTPSHTFSLGGEGYAPEGALSLEEKQTHPAEHPELDEIARAAALCNDAALLEKQGVWQVSGDPMEGALLSFAHKMEMDVGHEQTTWTRTDAIPFDAKYRFMATLNHDHSHHACAYVKGAPERILEMCSHQRHSSGETSPLDTEYWQRSAESIAAQGRRVLALAFRPLKPEHTVLERSDVEGSLTLLGLVGMIDPPRTEAIEAVQECVGAGIRVKMITGDHAQTAAAIGQQVGLTNTEKVLTGEDLDALDDEQLKDVVMQCNVFARTSPEHKLRLVTALQSHGMTVAMTGDGVNDAPALKRADAGIAMGRGGTEAAKEASDLVLADDNFASIVAAVREGRTVYDNLKKVISWTLPTSTGEALTIIVALLLGMTLPVSPVQILWINLITAATLGIALAFEPTEKRTMLRQPRPRNEPLLSRELSWHIVFVSLLFLAGVYGIYHYAIERGYSIELARTLVVNTLVVMEIFHLFFIRNIYSTSLNKNALKGTKVVWLVVLIVTLAQFAITYFSPLQAIFATEAVALGDGLLIFVLGVALFAILECEKQIRLFAMRRREISTET